MEYSSKGLPIKRGRKCFIKNSKLAEFTEWWYDDITVEADKGIYALFNKASF